MLVTSIEFSCIIVIIIEKFIRRPLQRLGSAVEYNVSTMCLKKTSPTFLAVTLESIVGFS